MDLIKEYMVQHAHKLGFLTVDLVFFGMSYYSYRHVTHIIECVKESQVKGENTVYTYNELENNRTYGLVKGTVKPIGQPLTSLYDNSITGVVQSLKKFEHVESRVSYGVWPNHITEIYTKNNTSPFCLVNDKFMINVQDVLSAAKLDLNMTYDKFEPSTGGLKDLLRIIISGSHHRGIQTTEEMLRVGTEVRVIGDIVVGEDNSYTIVAPDNKPFLILSDSIKSLLTSLESDKAVRKVLTLMFGCIAAAILCHSGHKIYLMYKARQDSEARDRRLRETRQARRAAMRDAQVVEELQCVICQTNQREILLMPCGHFCICEDCNKRLDNRCPICRTPIAQRIPSYL